MRSYLNPLNVSLDTTFDFTEVVWQVSQQGIEYVLQAEAPSGVKGWAYIPQPIWDGFAKHRLQILHAAVLEAASSLIDNSLEEFTHVRRSRYARRRVS